MTEKDKLDNQDEGGVGHEFYKEIGHKGGQEIGKMISEDDRGRSKDIVGMELFVFGNDRIAQLCNRFNQVQEHLPGGGALERVWLAPVGSRKVRVYVGVSLVGEADTANADGLCSLCAWANDRIDVISLLPAFPAIMLISPRQKKNGGG